MSIVMSKETIFTDELIRENARLTIQQEVDRQKIEALEQRVADQAENIASLEAHSYAREDFDNLLHYKSQLLKAIADLRFVMAGGDPCKVCGKKCMMGEGNCQPVWRGGDEA